MLNTLRSWVHLFLVMSSLLAGPALAAEPTHTIVVIGDSLSAEYGLRRGTGWVSQLSQRLSTEHPEYSVVNASVSGDTTSGGRSRLPRLLQRERPNIVIIELGANDGLRGLDLAQMRDNLQAMIEACRSMGARVLLVGIRIPPNYGRDYAERFFDIFGELARRNRISSVPFLLEGVAENLDFFQADHIHPTEQAQGRILDNVWPRLQPMLSKAAAPSAHR